jgi:predicted 3-demethylubiquinone-9 3-methyltransferase (glyoxalase superfamily)
VQKIHPFLWFDGQAEEAMNFYVSIFRNSKVGSVSRYGDAGPGPKGQLMTASFQLEGQDFTALNGGPMYKFTPAISLYVDCKNQEEVDRLWNKLSEGGQIQACGWVTDKFGVSWQIIPEALPRLMTDKNPKKAQAVMQAMLKMKKIEAEELQRAYDSA